MDQLFNYQKTYCNEEMLKLFQTLLVQFLLVVVFFVSGIFYIIIDYC